MICSKCGYQNPENNKFCSMCGTSLTSTDNPQNTQQETPVMVCWRCGHINPEDNQFCSVCGANLRKADQVSAGQPEIKFQSVKTAEQPKVYQEEKPIQPANGKSKEQNMAGNNLSFKIIGLLFAVLYLIVAISTIPTTFMVIVGIFGGVHIFLSIINLLSNILTILSYFAFAFMLALFAMRHTKDNEEMLYLGVVLAAVLRIIVETLNVIFTSFICLVMHFMDSFSRSIFLSWLLTLVFTLFVVGVLFALFLMAGKKPLLGKSIEELKLMMKELPEILQQEAEQLSSRFPAEKGSQEQHKSSYNTVHPHQLKTNRSLFKFILFTIFTCGIYSLIFCYEIARDINKICEEDGEHTAGLIPVFFFTIITCGIYWYIWEYQFADRLANNAPRYEVNISETGSTVLLWSFFGIFCCGVGGFVALHILIKNLNRLARAYNEKNSAQTVADTAGYSQ